MFRPTRSLLAIAAPAVLLAATPALADTTRQMRLPLHACNADGVGVADTEDVAFSFNKEKGTLSVNLSVIRINGGTDQTFEVRGTSRPAGYGLTRDVRLRAEVPATVTAGNAGTVVVRVSDVRYSYIPRTVTGTRLADLQKAALYGIAIRTAGTSNAADVHTSMTGDVEDACTLD